MLFAYRIQAGPIGYTTAPIPAHGCPLCDEGLGLWLSWTLIIAYCLLSFIVPMHLGRIKGRRLKDHGPEFRFRDVEALAYAAPAWLFALLGTRHRYDLSTSLWWFAGVGYVSAALSFVSGIRSVQDVVPRTAPYAGIVMALASHALFLTFGTSLPAGLCLSLLISLVLDRDDEAGEQLPTSWTRWLGIFTMGALADAAMLIASGPYWLMSEGWIG